MEQMTISDAFRDQLDGRRVCAGFFSTFSFEPEFFELEILPLMLGDEAWSPSDELRYAQLQLKMQAPGQPAADWAVAYDRDIFESQAAPRLEVDYLPVSVLPACQHAKLTVLLLDNASEGEAPDYSILLCAGSFNLTRAGWWENMEVGHWVELKQGDAPANIHGPLRTALAFYRNVRPGMPARALQRLLDGLDALQPTADHAGCSFYFSFSAGGRHALAFPKFLRDALDGQAGAFGPLEVISPFFAQEGDNRVVAGLLDQFESVRVLLPRDEKDRALIGREVFSTLGERVAWADWQPEVRQHLMGADGYRRLHAKIYHCQGRAGWHFIGSVNLSQQAFNRNVEAGFLLRGQCADLLQPLVEGYLPEQFEPQVEADALQDAGKGSMPLLHLSFDWLSGRLQLLSPEDGTLVLLDSESRCVFEQRLQAATLLESDFAAGRKLFARSSLIHAQWQALEGAEEPAHGVLLVSQRNLHGRPMEIPGMDLAGLLRLLHDMGQDERMASMSAMLEATLRLHCSDPDQYLSQPAERLEVASFFSEFSEVNGAFWALGQRLQEAGSQQDQRTLDYFLRGVQPDSLAGLLDNLDGLRQASEPGLIVRYLALLSIEELLQRHAAHADSELLPRVRSSLEVLQQTELAPALQAQGMDAPRFIAWYRREFLAGVARSLDNRMEACDADH